MKRLIIGCGYLGTRAAALWSGQGDEVWALTRSPARSEEFRSRGWHPLAGDVTDPQSLPIWPEVDTLLYAVGFDRAAGRPIREVYVEGLRNVLTTLPDSLSRVIYISSTGVYGETAGDVVDEASRCVPSRDNGRACLAAEELVRADPRFGSRSIILRLAGIYGPGRVPHRDLLERGQPLPVVADGYLNLIHVDDAARCVLTVAERGTAPNLYLVSDGQPVVRRDYYQDIARLLQAPEPRFEPPAADSPVALRAQASKRVSNEKLVRELGFTFQYPTARAGLTAILATT